MAEKVVNFKIPSQVFGDGVRYYWNQRSTQSRSASGVEGERSSVTGGKHLDGVLDAVVGLLKDHGVREDEIFVMCSVLETGKDGKLTLPGYFRPTKNWDLIVVRDKQLLAAMELKAQAGPSFGNNANNRAEEAIGSAEDFWTAHREQAFGQLAQPWLGYFFLLEDSSRSSREVATREPHFKVFEELRRASYAKRYEQLCKRLVLERKYTSACFLLSKRPAVGQAASPESIYTEPSDGLSARQFLDSLLRSVIPR